MLGAVPLMVALPYVIYRWSAFAPRPDTIVTDKTFVFLSILGILPAHLLTIALVWLLVTDRGKTSFLERLDFRWPPNLSPAVTTLLCVLFALVLLAIGLAITKLWGGTKTDIDLLLESSPAARIAVALVAVLTAPLAEELVYRGVLYSALERAANRAISVVVVSLLFAGVHVLQYKDNIGVILAITLLSFTLTLSRAYTGSLIPPFIIHFVFNGIQAIFIILSPYIEKYFQKSEQITPTTPGLELIGRLVETISVSLCRMT
jgi:membrane protease YdiL (CAAX protease family)